MLKEYTEDELYQLWLVREGLGPSESLAAFHDSTKLRQMAVADIRAWYARLLLNAPAHLLPCEDIAEETMTAYLNSNSAVLMPPLRYVRPVMLRMTDWEHNVYDFRPIDSDLVEQEALTMLASSPFRPRAYLRPDGSVEAHGIDRAVSPIDYYVRPVKKGPGKIEGPKVTSFTAVVRPPEGQYILDESLLFTNS